MDPARLRRAVTAAAVGLAAVAAVVIAQDPLPSAEPDVPPPSAAASAPSPEARVAALEARLAGRIAAAERLVRARAEAVPAPAAVPGPSASAAVAPPPVVALTPAAPVTSSASS